MNSGNQYGGLYGSQATPSAAGVSQNASIPPLGMGSLHNMSRAGTNALAQLPRGPTGGSPVNFSVGGGRITPTAVVSSTASAVGNFTVPGQGGGGGGGGGGVGMANLFPSGGVGNFPGFSSQASRQNFSGMNLLHSSGASNALSSFSFPSSTHPSGGRLFSRDKSKFGDSLLSPNAFDPSEFPSLSNRDNSAPNPALSRSNYVGMVKQPAMETSEFTMSHEDFPALPGVPSMPNNGQHQNAGSPNAIGDSGVNDSQMKLAIGGANNVLGTHQAQDASAAVASLLGSAAAAAAAAAAAGTMSSASLTSASGDNNSGNSNLQQASQQQQQQQPSQQQQQQSSNLRRGIQTCPDGRVSNIPQSMVTDQFGMIGLLTFIRAAETDPNLVSLALGADLTTLGLNLNSEVNLYPTFAGPWAETPCRPQDIDCHVPYEYLTNATIRDKLAPVKLNRYKDDVLFYMFYTNVGDVLQLAAAAELYNRDWRYHKEDRVWITRAPGLAPHEKTSTYERGTYFFFDVTNWRKVSKEFHVEYDKLEERPSLPTNLTSTGNSAGPGAGSGSAAGSSAVASMHQMPSSSSPAPPGMPPGGAGPPSVMGMGGQAVSPQQPQPHSPIMSVTSGVSGGAGPGGAPGL